MQIFVSRMVTSFTAEDRFSSSIIKSGGVLSVFDHYHNNQLVLELIVCITKVKLRASTLKFQNNKNQSKLKRKIQLDRYQTVSNIERYEDDNAAIPIEFIV